MADKVVVLHDGRVEQVGTPAELYGRPANAFVAGFIGRMNMLRSAPTARGGCSFAGRALRVAAGTGATLGIRPEEIVLCDPDEPGENRLTGTVRDSLYLGTRIRVTIVPDGAPDGETVLVETPGNAAAAAAGSRVGMHLPADALRVLQ